MDQTTKLSFANSFFGRSIGKKQLMAVTGLVLYGFLIGHLTGNTLLFKGAEKFNAYAEFLQSLGGLLVLVRVVLLVCFVVHIFLGIKLTRENRDARPIRYQVKKDASNTSFASKTMIYTGIILLIFIVVHLFNFTLLIPKGEGFNTFEMVAGLFSFPAYVVYYVFSMLVLGLHISHGLQSAFQTFGWNTPKFMPCIKNLSSVLGIVIAVGYISLPIFMFINHGGH
ncbi:succinate dehydrogenase cytochrome b subunit [bacterium]|nr:succinate dehydrogenase cytochrome b subunit [bacterium]